MEMPITIKELDSSAKEENITLVLGKNILLKIIENPEKQNLLKNKTVKKFVSIPDLCYDDVRLLVANLFEKEAYLAAPSFVQGLLKEKDKLAQLKPVLDSLDQMLAPLKESKLFKAMEKLGSDKDTFTKELLKQEDILPDLMLRIMGKIDKKQLQESEKQRLSINKEIEEKTGLKILVPSTLFVCSKCNVILIQDIANKKCLICNRKISDEDVKRIPIYRIPDEIRNVWSSNLWFEAYFARLLHGLGYETWTSVQAMGASGILHQVDVLAIKNGTVLTCECKTGKVSRNDVFNFCTKVSDLKSHIAVLALIGELPEPETREFVKKNPAIIRLENMGKMKEPDILNKLEERLSIKS